jgi:type IV pilus assembly protein PilY1
MKHRRFFARKETWLIGVALLGGFGLAQAASTDIANSPLVTSASATAKPNIMYMLDDSGSMNGDFIPDQATDDDKCRDSGSSTNCNGGGSNNNGTQTSGPPLFASQFNVITYNPAVTYAPPVDFDGTNTTYKSYTNATAPFKWATVRKNPFPEPGASGSSVDLTTKFPEEVWCDGSQANSSDAVHCRRNLQTNATFSIVLNIGPSNTVARATLPNHGCLAGDKVTISGATPNNYNGLATVLAANLTTNTFDYNKPGGGTGTLPTAAAGQVIISTACNMPITKLSRAVGTNTVTAVFPIPHGCVNNDTISIKGATGGSAGFNLSNRTITFVDERTLTYSTGGLNTNTSTTESGLAAAAPVAISTLCAGTKSNYSRSTTTAANTVPPLMQGFPQGVFNQEQTRSGAAHYYTINANEYCLDETLSKCIAPINEKPLADLANTYSFPALVRYCSSDAALMANPLSSTSTNACQRLFTSTFTKARYGYFTRMDIVAGPTYPKIAGTRLDCAGAASCTYTEEMTNFSNWYAYYRTRLHMAKSASVAAFKTLDQGYRVGLNTINAANRGTPPWLANAPFDNAVGGQKSKWFNLLYGIEAGDSTPLREALSRAGRYYGGLKSGAASYISDDPIEYSCQQNLTFLVTDGYWNGTGGAKLDGSAMDDQDGVAGVARPYLDASKTKDGLSDTAFYYYMTPLRTPSFNPTGALGLQVGVPVADQNVPPTTKDPNKAQHMVTYTMGLGLDGTLIYKAGYDVFPSGDYAAILNGTACGAVNPCVWPKPVQNTLTAVDDLWHAAVNGRGTYFSAKDPTVVTSGLLQAFASLSQKTGSEAAAATSTPNIVPGDNFVFSSTFTTLDWFGETTRQQIDTSTGAILGIDWKAAAQLDSKVSANSDTRNIYTFSSIAGNKLKSFLWANLLPSEQNYFNGTSGGRQQLAQWNFLSPSQQNACDNPGGSDCGNKLVNYLRGQRGNETIINSMSPADSANTSLFRLRVHVLGDIVSAEAGYVRLPVFNYGDQGYATFKTTMSNLNAGAGRQAALYLGANDGMLHALNATTGAEMWAYIPSMVMPNMWKLANFSYSTSHLFFVDGTPTTGDICTSNCSIASAAWSTILVGGLNAGGRGYYALDITDPANPKALWELKSTDASGNPAACVASVNNVPQNPVAANTFSDCDIGLSFGNPIITKRADGKWVVLVTSGYNNIAPGTGGGFLYVIDAVSGAILSKVATLILNPPGFAPGFINSGNNASPSGFAKINAFAANTNTDNTTLRVYGGDLNGNLWRIDGAGAPNTLSAGVNQATLLAILGKANALGTSGTGTLVPPYPAGSMPQSITTKPELGELVVNGVGTLEMVYVGSGRYLGVTDLTTTVQDTFYAIVDPLGVFSGYGAVHGNGNFVQQTLTEAVNPVTLATERFTTSNTVDYTSKKGWFIDFNPGNASPGERNNTDPTLTLGILSFTTNAPDSNPCNVGGKSYRYFIDYTTGGPLSTSVGGVSGALVAFAPSTRPIVVNVNGTLEQIINVQGTPQVFKLPPVPSSGGGKRIFWRELFN